MIEPNGSYNDLKREVNRGGLAPFLSPIASGVGAYYGVPISPEMAEKFFREAGRLSDGSWEKVAETIVNSIAVAFAAEINPNKVYGSNSCKEGFVWREANPTDYVCVTAETRAQTQDDNSQAEGRRNPDGGPWGPDTCFEGFVWREAFPGDHVCVTWQTREQVLEDNRLADSRRLAFR